MECGLALATALGLILPVPGSATTVIAEGKCRETSNFPYRAFATKNSA